MYIRAVKTRSKGKDYVVHRLVEAYKTQDGKVRQKVIMNLGVLDIPRNRWKELATLLEQRINGTITFETLSSDLDRAADDLYARFSYFQAKPQVEKEALEARNLQYVDLNSIQTGEHRSLGLELVAEHFWNELDMDAILGYLPMSHLHRSVAKALILGRLLQPGSERATHIWLRNRTTLLEFLEEDLSDLGKDSFYTAAEELYEYKDKIEAHLYDQETRLFELERSCFLFDLTNTFVEGTGDKNPLAAYGKSKEHRYDCPLISLALMVDVKGFPIISRVYEGNVSEPKTLPEIIADLQRRATDFTLIPPVFIMDRGIATQDNVAHLVQEGYRYLVIDRAPREKEYEEAFGQIKACLASEEPESQIERAGWVKVDEDHDVYVKQVNDRDILTFSLGREQKELAMDTAQEERFLRDAHKLQASVAAGHFVNPKVIGQRIEKLAKKYGTIAARYHVAYVPAQEGSGCAGVLEIEKLPVTPPQRILAGCYVLSTNQTVQDPTVAWKTYMTLTRVEAAFRSLKTDLGLRPVYHQLEKSTPAHLFISVLAYHLLVSIEHRLREAGIPDEWRTVKAILSTHQRTTVNLVGENNEVYQIRVNGRPEPAQLEIYRALGVKVPSPAAGSRTRGERER